MTLKCQMTDECKDQITHIDKSGFIYCQHHGEVRKQTRINCRKLRSYELNRLKNGLRVKKY